jgi:glutaminyl-peptide cyclotransferase
MSARSQSRRDQRRGRLRQDEEEALCNNNDQYDAKRTTGSKWRLWWKRRSRATRLAMKALGVGLALAVIVNLYALFGVGHGQQQQDNKNNGRNVNWRSGKDSHLRVAAPVIDADLDYFANLLGSRRNLEQHIGNILIPRVAGTPGNAKVRKYITDQMSALDWDVETVSHDQGTPVGRVAFHNVIATLDPDSPRRLVLACHYDSLGTPEGFLGATDSAVPCAQMLNLAHAMDRDLKEDRARRHQVTLQLIFFDGEEAFVQWSRRDSTYGARNLASVWQNQTYGYQGIGGSALDRMDVMVLLDLIGAKDPQFTSTQRKTQLHFNRMARIEADLRKTNSLNGRKSIFQSRTNYFASVEDDHIPFLERGVPILHLIVLPFPEVWHKLSDNANAIDIAATEDINKIVRVFVAEYLQLTRPQDEQQY